GNLENWFLRRETSTYTYFFRMSDCWLGIDRVSSRTPFASRCSPVDFAIEIDPEAVFKPFSLGLSGSYTFSRPARRSFLLLDIGVPEAFRGVVIYHSYRLHERIADSWADEPETSPTQLLAQRVRLFGCIRNLAKRAELVSDWFAADKSPDVSIERTEFFTCC